LVVVALALAAPVRAAEPFRYAEGRHGKGELKYVNGVPVLILAGTPEEMGEQMGVLALKPSGRLAGLIKDVAKNFGPAWPVLARVCDALFARFPAEYRREVEAMARAGGWDRELLVVANTISDVQKIAGCSAAVIEAERSATGRPLFARNFDFPNHFDVLHEHSLLVVRRPAGKRAFADVSFPGLLVCGTAFNDAGLALASNDIAESKDGAARFDPTGLPFAAAGRRILEDCAGIADAEKLVRGLKATTMGSVVLCDRTGGAVFEITPKTFAVRRAEGGVCAATNHFRAPGLAADTRCDRYEVFVRCRTGPKLGPDALAPILHAARQDCTIHTLVFEPATLRLHLSLAKPPSSAAPLRLVELGPLFQPR
jgi:hypothetical protein